MGYRLIEGDCVEAMAAMEECSVDAVVCDPPYGLGFMGKQWDAPGKSFVERKAETRNRFDHVGGNHNPSNAADAARTAASENRKAQHWHEAWAREALRVLKPGGHLLAFGGTRTYHRLACAVEDAGFEVRDTICWLYGSGFPKSLDVSKAIDAAAGAERERGPRVGGALNAGTANGWSGSSPDSVTAPLAGTQQIGPPATPEAEQWSGWGTALKPAHEPIVVARKPLVGTVAANVLEWSTGALNIGGCRVGTNGSSDEGGGSEAICDDCRDAVPGVREDDACLGIDAEADQDADVREGVPLGDDAPRTEPALERRSLARRPGLRDREHGGPRADARAPSRDGAGHRTEVAAERDGASSRRGQDEQPADESRTSRGPLRAHTRTRQDGCARCGRALPPASRVGAAEGRWPANVVLDERSADLLDAQTGETSFNPAGEFGKRGRKGAVYGGGKGIAATVTEERDVFGYGDSGGASRFFYVAKASRAERNAGTEALPQAGSTHTAYAGPNGVNACAACERTAPQGVPACPKCGGEMRNRPALLDGSGRGGPTALGNHHPTVKPIALMRWLVRLVTPPGGTVLDPFTGSGTTGCAAVVEGMEFVGVEREAEYVAIARARIELAERDPGAFEPEERARRAAAAAKVAGLPTAEQFGLFDDEDEPTEDEAA